MDTSELALSFFSILAQLAVGSFLVLSLVTWLVERKTDRDQADLASGWGWWAILAVMVAALIVSLFHLGNIKNAVLSVVNWQSAWLSREILAALVFTGLVAAYTFMKWKKVGSPSLQLAVMMLTNLTGIVLVYIMSMIYTYVRTQPAWNTPFTMLSFFNTALILGALGAGVILAANYWTVRKIDTDCQQTQCRMLRSALQGVSLGAIVLLGIELVALPLYLLNLGFNVEGGAATVRAITTQFGGLLTLRLLLGFLGAGVLAAIIYKVASKQGSERLASQMIYSAFALVLIAEWFGRFIFYTSNVGIGIL